MSKVEKLVRDGRVAVLYSPGFGAGWSTWASQPDCARAMLFDTQIADIVDRGEDGWRGAAEAIAEIKYPDEYLGGLGDLQVAWLPVGTEFVVEEYDGSESIKIRNDVEWQVA